MVGRISPEGKRRVVEALTASGRYVAMVGDGVNDVPALKAARLAIAQGTGAQIAKSVADLVLVRGEFAAVPAMVREGRRILRNLQRVAKLFVTKSAFAAFLILSIGLTPLAYPLLPRHLTLVASLTVGIPGFFLALAPSSGRLPRTGFLRDVSALRRSRRRRRRARRARELPLPHLRAPDLTSSEARTVATTVLVLVGLYLIVVLEASSPLRGAAVTTLCATLLGALYAVVLAVPGRASSSSWPSWARQPGRPRARRRRARDRRALAHGRPLRARRRDPGCLSGRRGGRRTSRPRRP